MKVQVWFSKPPREILFCQLWWNRSSKAGQQSTRRSWNHSTRRRTSSPYKMVAWCGAHGYLTHLWWSGIDKAIEKGSKGCTGCQLTQSNPSKPLAAHHVDSAGPFFRTMFLIVVDAHSKLPEVIPIATTNTTRTIEELRKLFTPHSLPEQLASDNEPQFIAKNFRAFVRSNGTEQVRSAPYYPATNALDERLVQTFKQAFRATMPERNCLSKKLANLLVAYRATPHTNDGENPAILLMGRNIRTRLDVPKPNISKRVEEKQPDQELRSCNITTRKLDSQIE